MSMVRVGTIAVPEANYFLDPSIDIRSKFDRWKGNIASGADETPSGHLLMDGPKVIIALNGGEIFVLYWYSRLNSSVNWSRCGLV